MCNSFPHWIPKNGTKERGIYMHVMLNIGMTFLLASSSPLVHPLLDSPRKILQSTVDVHVRDGERNDAAMKVRRNLQLHYLCTFRMCDYVRETERQ